MPAISEEHQKLLFDLEWQIINDKLLQGANGVEWLVLHATPKPNRERTLGDWLKQLIMYDHKDIHAVMRDTLTLDSDSFFKKYEFNWWMSVSYTITYLIQLKQQDYNLYFQFIWCLGKDGEQHVSE
ncbi:hypothetical protein P9847_01370 [Paenibacillus chibensis]|uniref:Uncharacterized protein n=1 Tax=Paenibacillus chibensis TaxID=59846 RepID=A0ABU6PPB1_9BACL|nr:hypothetical protein [Paenibacillus chibensis]